MKTMVRLVIVTALLTTAVFLTMAWAAPALPKFAAGSVMDKIQKRGKLIAAVRNDVQYLGYLDPTTNRVEGFEVELAKELAKAILGDPEKVEITQVTAKSRIPLLQVGEVDLVIANFTISTERKKEVDFGKPHLSLAYQMIVLKDSPYQKLSDLAGKQIAVNRGSEYIADGILARLPNVKIVYFESKTEEVLAVSTKRVDGSDSTDFATAQALAKNPNLRAFSITADLQAVGLEPNLVAAGFRKGEQDFVEFWNRLLDRLAASGRLKELFLKNMPSGMDLGALPFPVK